MRGFERSRLPQSTAGLSHMSKELVEVRPAQPCEVHFASDRSFIWVGTQDIERDATDQREVLWCVVFTCSGCVLVEADVQVPMQLVLDAPCARPSWSSRCGDKTVDRAT